MPCPTNSRTTLNPAASTCSCTAAPTSPIEFHSRLLDPAVQRSFRNFQQLLQFRLQSVPDRHSDCCVSVVPVEYYSTIDRDDVSLFQQPFLRRNAVHDLFVHRCAQHTRIIVIPFECRLGAKFFDLLLGLSLQIHGRDTPALPSPSHHPVPGGRCGRYGPLFQSHWLTCKRSPCFLLTRDDLQ